MVLNLTVVKFVLPPPLAGKTAVIDLKTQPTFANLWRLPIDLRDCYLVRICSIPWETSRVNWRTDLYYWRRDLWEER